MIYYLIAIIVGVAIAFPICYISQLIENNLEKTTRWRIYVHEGILDYNITRISLGAPDMVLVRDDVMRPYIYTFFHKKCLESCVKPQYVERLTPYVVSDGLMWRY
jgi:hypothetical protein